MKKIRAGIGIIIFILITIFSMFFYKVEADTLNPALYFGIVETRGEDGMGYSILDPSSTNGYKIWNIVQYASQSASTYTDVPYYCIKAGVGFTEGTGDQGIETYNLQFDMYEDRVTIASQDSSSTNILHNLVTGGHYNELLALANLIYVPGVTTESEKQELLDESGVSDLQGQFVVMPNPTDYCLTDEEIEAVQQAVIWHFTNYGEDNGKFDKYGLRSWLYYTEDGGRTYRSLSSYSPSGQTASRSEGTAKQRQAEALYEYLVDTAEANADQYAEGSK